MACHGDQSRSVSKLEANNLLPMKAAVFEWLFLDASSVILRSTSYSNEVEKRLELTFLFWGTDVDTRNK